MPPYELMTNAICSTRGHPCLCYSPHLCGLRVPSKRRRQDPLSAKYMPSNRTRANNHAAAVDRMTCTNTRPQTGREVPPNRPTRYRRTGYAAYFFLFFPPIGPHPKWLSQSFCDNRANAGPGFHGVRGGGQEEAATLEGGDELGLTRTKG